MREDPLLSGLGDDELDAAIAVFRDLVRVDSSNPPGCEREAALLLRDVLEAQGIVGEIREAEAGRANIVARIPGGGKPPVVLLSHLDVVPADPAQWAHHPFSADEAEGSIWGRGTLDTKQLTAMQLAAFLHLRRSGIVPVRDVIFVATADEEAGSRLGMEYLVKELSGMLPDPMSGVLAISEGGGFPIEFGGRVFMLCTMGERAVCRVRLSGGVGDDGPRHLAEGIRRIVTGFSSVNAGSIARGFLDKTGLESADLCGAAGVRDSAAGVAGAAGVRDSAAGAAGAAGVRDSAAGAAGEAGVRDSAAGAAGEAGAADECMRGLLRHVLCDSVTVNRIRCGAGIPEDRRTGSALRVPGDGVHDAAGDGIYDVAGDGLMGGGLSQAELELRMRPETTEIEARGIVERLLEDSGVACEITAFEGGFTNDPDSPLPGIFERACRRYGLDAEILPIPALGRTDGRFLGSRGASVYGFSPVLVRDDFRKVLARVHGVDERIGLDSFLFGCRVLGIALMELCVPGET